jgi:hypothetical protein
MRKTVPLLSAESQKVIAFEGLLQWAEAVVVQAKALYFSYCAITQPLIDEKGYSGGSRAMQMS